MPSNIVLAKFHHEEDVVEKAMGTFGRWHVWVTIALFLVKFPVAWHQLNIVIECPPVKFECADNNTDQCADNCTSHTFDKSVFERTIVTDWDLVCEKKHLAPLVQLITMLGIFVGNLVFGILSDVCGRRIPLVAAIVLQLAFGCASGFVPIFWLYLIFRFVTASAIGGSMITSFVFIMEIIGVKWRTTIGILNQIPFNLGHLSLALVGYFIRDWRYMQLAISAPCLLLVTYYWILPESPRWLIAVERVDDSIRILEKIARYNKLPTEHIKKDIEEYAAKVNLVKHHAGNVLDLFRTPHIRKNWFCISFNWLVCGLCFYGVSQMISQIGGDIFVEIAISASVQIPGTFFCLWSIKALGRKRTLMLANIVAGASCLGVACLPENPKWPRALLGSGGTFGLMISFPTAYIYTGELFPTIIRNIAVGTSSMCARIGSMVAPYIAGLSTHNIIIAPIIFGIVPLIGALLCIWLPETLDCKLPDTIEEAEEFGRKSRRGSRIEAQPRPI